MQKQHKKVNLEYGKIFLLKMVHILLSKTLVTEVSLACVFFLYNIIQNRVGCKLAWFVEEF